MKKLLKNIFYPFGKLTTKTKIIVYTVEILLIFLYLQFGSDISTIPKPTDVLLSFWNLISGQETEAFPANYFYDNLFASLVFIGKGLFTSIIITLFFAYASTIEGFRLIVEIAIKMRYLAFACVIYLFTMLTSTIESLKLLLLVFGITPFFITTIVADIDQVRANKTEINKAMINKKNKWQTLLEVIIIGKIDWVFRAIKQNSAIAWSIITSVEGYTLAGGGIGTMIIKSNRHVVIADVLALGIIVMIIGILLDQFWTFILKSIPYNK